MTTTTQRHNENTQKYMRDNKTYSDKPIAPRPVRETEERERAKALAAENARIAKEIAEKAEADKKAANEKHRAAIHRAALADMVADGIDEETGKKIITAIAKGYISHVRIDYSGI